MCIWHCPLLKLCLLKELDSTYTLQQTALKGKKSNKDIKKWEGLINVSQLPVEEITCPIFSLIAFWEIYQVTYPTIMFSFLTDCYKFYKARFEPASPKPLFIMVSPSSVWLDKILVMKVASFHEEFVKLFR